MQFYFKFIIILFSLFQLSVTESINFSNCHHEPKNDTFMHWENTAFIRTQQRKKSEKFILQLMFKNWLILKDPLLGPDLIDIDFKLIKLTKVNLTEKLWESFFNILRSLLLTSHKLTTLTFYLSRH